MDLVLLLTLLNSFLPAIMAQYILATLCAYAVWGQPDSPLSLEIEALSTVEDLVRQLNKL